MNQNSYEDEIDRMRSRNGRKRSRQTASPEAFEIYEDAGKIQPDAPRHKKMKRKKRWIISLACLLVLFVIGGFLYRSLRATGYWTIAVFGVDSRDGNLGKGALSDVEMLCSINRRTGEIRLASVFRDSYLRIDEQDSFDKINEAYFLGGHKQAVNALEANFDLKVDDYATFNWKAVVDAINVLGGVDLEITDEEFAYINSFITETVESTNVGSVHLEHSGMNHLDGVQAVAYARLRLMDTDFNRTERQRKVLGLAMDKAKQADAASLKALVTTVFPQISTSIGLDDLLGMAKNARKYYIGQTSGFPFSHVEMKIGKKSCVIPATLESNVTQLHSFLYDDTQYTPSETVREISSRIAQDSGVGEPGKDTESGKNVGAEGSGGSQPQSPAKQETAQPQPETPAPQADSGTESAAEASTEAEETTETTETEAEEGSKEESSEDPGNILPLESKRQPETSAGAPTSGHPSVSPTETTASRETSSALEAPGQGSTSSQEQTGHEAAGPGGSGNGGSGNGGSGNGGPGNGGSGNEDTGSEDSGGSGVVSAPGA